MKTKKKQKKKTIKSNEKASQLRKNIASYRLAGGGVSTVIAVTFAACRKGECRNRGEVPLPRGNTSLSVSASIGQKCVSFNLLSNHPIISSWIGALLQEIAKPRRGC